MATVSKPPFEVTFVVNPEGDYKKNVQITEWWNPKNGGNQLTESSFSSVEENDELDLIFKCDNPQARIYFDGLECCPATNRVSVDDDGFVYCLADNEPLKLYRSNSNYDALRVDLLQLRVVIENETFITFLKILPKHLTLDEWVIMRDALESEIRGLSQDIVRRNIGLGDDTLGVIPPEDLYSFLVINKYANAIMSALIDIKDKPKYKLIKEYIEEDEARNHIIDTETVKHYLRNGKTTTLVVPKRKIVYDIQENRLLKKIVKECDKKLEHFIGILECSLTHIEGISSHEGGKSLYNLKFIEGLHKYLDTAKKLKKITNIIKSAEWFNAVSNQCDTHIPHSFAVDSRYGSLYRMYVEMGKDEFSIKLHSEYSYSWKKSSQLYEIWSYIVLVRNFIKHYKLVEYPSEALTSKKLLFPFLNSGTKVVLENDNSIIEVVYDVKLPTKSRQVKRQGNPLFMTCINGNHFRPDICINLYSKTSNWYIGSYIVECKYRRVSSFYTPNGTRSSKEQIIAYHNDSKSPIFCNAFFASIANVRPVHKVFVFTPDLHGNQDKPDDVVFLRCFKPSDNHEITNTVCEELFSDISNKIKEMDNFYFKTNK